MPDPNLSHSFLHCEMEIFIGRIRQYVEKRVSLMSRADFFCAFEGQKQTGLEEALRNSFY